MNYLKSGANNRDLNCSTVTIQQIFRDNPKAFPNFAGDTERLTFFIKLELLSEPSANQDAMESSQVVCALKRL